MMDKNDKWKTMSDAAILEEIGSFVKHHRLEANISQKQLAEDAGINRTTLNEFEKGRRSNTLTLIQILRALDKLNILNIFEIETRISPLKLAEIELSKKQRASKRKVTGKKSGSEW
jgi:transcriptional regulator with XRE-family HTH domain